MLSFDVYMVLQFIQEKVLEIEYIKAVVPRKEEEPSMHGDWVSAVDSSSDRYAYQICKSFFSCDKYEFCLLTNVIVLSDRYILTGCYDGFGR